MGFKHSITQPDDLTPEFIADAVNALRAYQVLKGATKGKRLDSLSVEERRAVRVEFALVMTREGARGCLDCA